MSWTRPRSVAAGALLLTFLILAALIPYTVRFVASEHTLYHADQLAYWSLSSGLAEAIRTDPWAAIVSISSSVATSDLSLLPAVPVALVLAAVGDSRLAYLLAVLLTYGVAVVISSVAALAVVDPDRARAPWWSDVTAAAIALLLLPSLWRPVFLGYLDLGGVAICIVVVAVYLRRGEPPASAAELALIGFLVALLALFRRWYTVWAIAFAAVVAIEAFVGCWRWRREGWRRALAPLRAPAIVGLVAAVTVAVLAPGVVVLRLGPGYADRFAAYGRADTFASNLRAAVDEFGLVTLATALIGGLWLALRPSTRRIGLVIGLQLGLTWILMTRLQHHGHQHWYLYGSGLVLLVGLAVVRVMAAPRPPVVKALLAGSALLVGSVTSVAMYATWAGPAADALEPWVSARRVRPAVRNDLGEVNRLLHQLDRLTDLSPGYVYVLASSEVVSDQVLAFANRSLDAHFSCVGRILQSAHVDLRDGFPALLLEAEWVVVARPVQTHLDPARQQVVVIPAECFLEDRGVARAFERVPDAFYLEGGVSVEIYHRVRPITPEEVADLSDRLRASYPDRPQVYEP